MESTTKISPYLTVGVAPVCSVATQDGVQLAPIAAQNAPHLPRYRRSQLLIEQAYQAAQQAMADREARWSRV